MQQQKRVAAVLVGLCLAAALHEGAAVTVSATAKSQALKWLHARRNAPHQDELAELKAENPSAYALVKALLTKRSLGLLDPKHPTASFAPAAGSNAAQSAPVDSVPQGAAAFERIAEESGTKPKAQAHVSLEYPDVNPAPAHHDWLNWKPSQSAVDDDAMVKSVLGEVAELKGGAAASSPNLRGQGNADSAAGNTGGALQWNDFSASLAVTPVADAPPAPPAAPAAPAAPIESQAMPKASMSQQNSYLNGLDFGVEASSAQAQRSEKAEDNSYLKGFSFGGEAAAPARGSQLGLTAAKQMDSHDYLASFSWDDDAAAKAAAAPKEAATPSQETSGTGAKASTGATGGNALLAWLGGSAPAAPAKVAPKAPAAPQNGYMMDLQ